MTGDDGFEYCDDCGEPSDGSFDLSGTAHPRELCTWCYDSLASVQLQSASEVWTGIAVECLDRGDYDTYRERREYARGLHDAAVLMWERGA